MDTTASISDRIEAVATEAATARTTADSQGNPTADDALDIARDGVWPTLRIYIDARRTDHRFSHDDHTRLEQALNDWLAVYAAAHGYDIDPEVPVRDAGETFLDTHNITDTAQILTGIDPSP